MAQQCGVRKSDLNMCKEMKSGKFLVKNIRVDLCN